MSTTKAYNEHELCTFMNMRRCTKSSEGSLASVTGMGEIKGKWKITDEDYPKFLDLLHDYLFVKHGRCMNFVEQPKEGEAKPLLIDLDFRYSADTSLTRAFGISNIESFVYMVVDAINELFPLDSYEVLRFFVTLRPSPYKEGTKQKDGVHILCPDMALSNEKQAAIRKWLLKNESISTCFQNTGYTNPDDNVYDESMTHKQGWIFFGESKPNIAPYQLETVFAYTPSTGEWIEEDTSKYSNRDLIEILSVRYNIVEDINEVKEEAKDLYKDLLKVSSAPPDPVTPIATDAGNSIIDAINYLYGGKTIEEQEFTMIRRFVLECLKESWWDDYDKWIRVGWCLNNISQTEEMLGLYQEFSQRSGKSGETDWEKIRKNWFSGM